MRLGFKGLDNVARRIDKVYVGVNNIARKCVKGYVGVNGVATLIYPVDQVIPTVTGHYTYDRTIHEAEISNYDPEFVEVIGTTQTSQAGTHTITFKLKSDLFRWEDGTSEPKYSTWVIDKAKVAVPTITALENTYDGAIHSATVSQYDPYAISVGGEVSAINAGTHVVTLNLTSTTNYSWEDDTTEQKTASWIINSAIVEAPTVSGDYTYNGKSQKAVISNYDTTAITASGDTGEKKDAGNYSITFTLNNPTGIVNYTWSDGSTSAIEVPWDIAKYPLEVPTVTSNLVYKGTEQSVTFSKYDTTLISLSGTTKGIAVKSDYEAMFTIIDFTNYKWINSDQRNQIVYWGISKKSIDVPTVTSNLRYKGTVQSPTINNWDKSAVSATGDLSATAVRINPPYKITFNLIDPKNTQWNTSTETSSDVTAKYGEWTIGKAQIVVPWLTNASYSYDGAAHAPTITYKNSNDKDMITVGGTYTAQTNANTYYVTFDLNSGVVSNYEWETGDITQKRASWVIDRKVVAVPTATGNYYTGNKQTVALKNYSSSIYQLGGDYQGTNVQSYKAMIKPKSNYRWSDGSQSYKDINWSIQKAHLALSVQLSIKKEYIEYLSSTDEYHRLCITVNAQNDKGEVIKANTISVSVNIQDVWGGNVKDVWSGNVMNGVTAETSYRWHYYRTDPMYMKLKITATTKDTSVSYSSTLNTTITYIDK